MIGKISYEFGPPVEVTPETPKPGYDKEGKPVVGEKAIAPVPEGHGWTWRRLLDNTTFTFGIKNLSDAHPPLAFVGNGAYQGLRYLRDEPDPKVLLRANRKEVLSFCRGVVYRLNSGPKPIVQLTIDGNRTLVLNYNRREELLRLLT